MSTALVRKRCAGAERHLKRVDVVDGSLAQWDQLPPPYPKTPRSLIPVDTSLVC